MATIRQDLRTDNWGVPHQGVIYNGKTYQMTAEDNGTFTNSLRFKEKKSLNFGTKVEYRYDHYSVVKGTDENDEITGSTNERVHATSDTQATNSYWRTLYVPYETFYGYGGDDIINANDGDDTIYGGIGHDILSGGNGSDSLYGEEGNDIIYTGDVSTGGNSDQVYGGADADTIYLGNTTTDIEIETSHWSDFAAMAADKVLIHAAAFAGPVGSIAKSAFDLVKALVGNEWNTTTVVDDVTAASYATIHDFDPREDVMVIPLSASSNDVNIEVLSGAASTAGDMTINYLNGGGTLGVINFDGVVSGADTFYAQALVDTALVFGNEGTNTNPTYKVSYGVDGTDFVNVDTSALSGLTGGFIILGAYSGKSFEYKDETDIHGTHYGDVMYGYISKGTADASDSLTFAPEDDGSETFYGYGGDDVFYGGAGGNRFYGGDAGGTNYDDSDTVSYEDANSYGIEVDLSDDLSGYVTVNNGFQSDTDKANNTTHVDRLYSIENIIGTQYNDTITGDNGSNLLEGGDGVDVLNGGAGIDTVSFSGAENGVIVKLWEGKAHDDGFGNTDTVQNFENAIGSDHNDLISGSANANDLVGGLGNDTLYGGAGEDTLMGGSGDDTLNGHGGQDTVSYSDVEDGVNVQLWQGKAHDDGFGNTDIVQNIENVIGSDYNDFIGGSSSANRLEGGNGTDEIYGGAGDDTLIGGSSYDYMDGKSGNDTVDYSSSTSRVQVSLQHERADDDGLGAHDKLLNIENIVGSDHGDYLTGSAVNNEIDGGDGNDVIYSSGGTDTFTGGQGSDTFLFYSSDGIDTITDFGVGADHIRILKNGFGLGSVSDSVARSTIMSHNLGGETPYLLTVAGRPVAYSNTAISAAQVSFI